MTIATLRLDLRFNPPSSARETRKQLQAIMEKLHKHFNVSIAGSDSESAGEPGAIILVAATVARTRREVRETLERVADAVASHPRAEILRNEYSEV